MIFKQDKTLNLNGIKTTSN